MLKSFVVIVCLLQNLVFGQDIQFPFDVSQYTNFFGNFPQFLPNTNNNNNNININNNNGNGVAVDDRGSFGEIVKPQVVSRHFF